MKRNIKRIVSFVMILAMILSMSSMSAFADTWSSITNTTTGITISVSSGTENLNIAVNPGTESDYIISSTVSGYFPQAFSMQVSSTSATVTGTNNASFAFDSGTYGLVTMGSSSSILTVTLGSDSFTIYVPAPVYSGATSTTLKAYLPAYGQYVNEGITTGGWGDGYVSGNTGLKSMVNNHITTGVSLGSFGGYAVFQFADGITNSSNHPYGVDFIVYGNAFSGNAEPGCVQVSMDGEIWYDLAGSRHYIDADWNAYAIYTNPTKANDSSSTAPQTGTFLGTGTSNAYSYSTNSGTVSVIHNSFHNHSWYPLYANYFTARTSGATELANRALCEKQSGAAATNNDFLTYTPYNGTTASSIKLTGTRIPFSTNSSTSYDYTFGYFDVHANGSNYGTAVNPYAATSSSSGGDGFDLSWAVDKSGKPVSLSTIYYVRLYTGVASMGTNSAFGEASSEVTGIYVASNDGVSTINEPTSVSVSATSGIPSTYSTTNGGNQAIRLSGASTAYITVNSTSSYIYVNGEVVSSGIEKAVTLTNTITPVQIITQDGTESPYVTVFLIRK